MLLCLNLDFDDYCDWRTLTSEQWVALLIRRPELSKYCNWSVIDATDWNWMASVDPFFVEKLFPREGS